MTSNPSLLVCLIGILLVPSRSESESGSEFVVTLTESNFSSFVAAQERTLLEFYAPWCGHCQELAPKYEEAARILSQETESPTKLAKVDATEAPNMAEQFGVEGYPTLVLVEASRTAATTYDGGRETQEIVDWVLKHDIPAFTLITYDEFEESKTQNIDLEQEPKREFEIFAFIKKGSKRDTLFTQFANEGRGDKTMTFYKIYLKDDDEYKVVMRRNNDKEFADALFDGDRDVVYNGKLLPSKKSRKSIFRYKSYDISIWIQQHKYPFFINLDKDEQETHPYSVLYTHPKVPKGGIIIIRVPEDDDVAVSKLKGDLIEFVRELRANEGFMVILTSKSIERIGFTDDVNMLLVHKTVVKVAKLPAGYEPMEGDPNRANPASYFIEKSQGKAKETLREYRYQYRESVEINSDVLKTFVNDAVVDKTAKRWLRSAITTDKSDDIFYDIITANTFGDTALDKASDTLVLYCTSWGKHCQSLMEEYNKLAQHMQTYYKGKSINIAYMDCDENDVDDIRVDAFPTMILYVGGTDRMENGKLLSQQQRTMDDIVDFLDEYATSLNKEEL